MASGPGLPKESADFQTDSPVTAETTAVLQEASQTQKCFCVASVHYIWHCLVNTTFQNK